MTEDDILRGELARVAAAAPAVGFTAADVIRRGRRRRQVRRTAAAGTAAVALALVVAVPTVAFRDGGAGPETAGPTVAGPDRTPVATPTGVPAPPDPTGPAGLAAAEAARLAEGCGRSFGGVAGTVDPTPDPGARPGPTVRDSVRLYNLVRDEAGAHALLYGPRTYLSCTIDRSGEGFNSGGGTGPEFPEWLPGPLSVDDSSAAAGGSRDPDLPPEPGHQVVAGRVAAQVTEVRVELDGQQARVPVVNGTYLVRFLHGTDWEPAQRTPVPTVTGYDARGRTVGTLTGYPRGCFTSPAGDVVIDGRSGDGAACAPAVRWGRG